MAENDNLPTVLVVDDERSLADLYAEWLNDQYNVWVAYGGQDALDQIDDRVDVMLLDRRMPNRSGDAVLKEVRNRDLDCGIALVTAVEPDVEVIRLGFDLYMTKPMDRGDVQQLVQKLLAQSSLNDTKRQLKQIEVKRRALERSLSADEREENEQYQTLVNQHESLRNQVEEHEAELDGSVTDPLLIGSH